METVIPRPYAELDDQPAGNKRIQPRSSMFLVAVMRSGTEQAPVKVRNMSPNGAMVDTPFAPSRGTSVDLMRGPFIARGTVMWSSGNRVGLRFSSEVSVKEWLAPPTAVHQQRVDDIVALVKAGGLPQLESASADHAASREVRTHEQLVDDLAATMRLLGDLEDDLASCDETLARHGMKLQNLDIAMQMLRAVAAELMPSSKERVSLAKIEDLRVTCAKALGR